MFKPKDYDDLDNLISGFDWQLLISNPNADGVQDWVAKVNGLLWDFDSPSANEFQKKIDSFTNMWGGVNAGTLPNYDLNHDVNDIKRFLRIKLEGMRREKEKVLSGDNTKLTEKKESISKPNFGNITISGGTVVFGDGAKITQVAVRELVDALSEEIKEKVPESEEKKKVLQTLENITTNETFASVAGTVIGEILRRVTRP